LTQRDRGLIAALLAVFVVVAVAAALPNAGSTAAPTASAQPGQTTPGSAQGSGGPRTGSATQSGGGGGAATGTGAGTGQPSGTGTGTGTGPSSGTAEPGATDQPTDAPSPSAPDTVPTIRQGVISMPTSINPLTARTQADRDLVALVFSGLVKLGPDDAVVGDLADRWTVDKTGRLWTFHIRDGETWQDGEPVTADDVVFTVKLLRDPSYTGPLAGSWNEITARKINTQTVRFTLTSALGDFLQVARQPLLPSHLLSHVPASQIAASAFSSAPVGSGPYRLLQWDQSTAILERTDAIATGPVASPAPSPSATPATSAGTETPIRLELHFYPDAVTLAAAYRAGQLDMADGLPSATARALDESVPGTRIVRDPRSTLTAVLLNLRTNHPTVRDDTVRRALLMAVNRDKLVNDVIGGFGERADTLIPPQSWAFVANSANAVPYDTTRAAGDLKAAGWRKVNGKWHPPGSKNIFTIELVTTTKATNPITYAAAQFVAASWRSFGITVRVVALAPNVLVGERLARANFTAALVDINIGLDPDLYPLLASRQAGIGGSNLSGVQSLVLDDLLVAARKPGTLPQRRSAFAKLESFLSTSQVTLPLAFRDDAMVISDRVVGPSPRLLGDLSDRFWDVLLWRLASGR
jgi:peptide/nickel transport system substrate-binding protein